MTQIHRRQLIFLKICTASALVDPTATDNNHRAFT